MLLCPPFILYIRISPQRKSVRNAAEQLEMVSLLVIRENLLRYVARLCWESVIDFSAGEEDRLFRVLDM